MKVRGKHGEAPTEETLRLRVKLKSRRYLIKSRRCLIKSRRYLLKSRRYLIVFRRDLLLPRWEAWATDLNRDECRSVFNRTARNSTNIASLSYINKLVNMVATSC